MLVYFSPNGNKRVGGVPNDSRAGRRVFVLGSSAHPATISPNSSGPDKRYHDFGKCRFNCSYQILTPVFHVDEGIDPILMFNLHSDPVRGIGIEQMLDCVYKKLRDSSSGNNINLPRAHNHSLADEADIACGATLRMSKIRKFATRGPASPIFQPIRPVYNRSIVSLQEVGREKPSFTFSSCWI